MELLKKGKEFRYKKRLSIGFVVDRINEVGGYQYAIWDGMSEAAKEKDFNVMCFTGGQLKQSTQNKNQLIPNQIYDLISKQGIDGLIICSMAIGSGIGVENVTSFCHSFPDLPTVSIGVAIEGIPSLVIDNKSGIRLAVSHLIEQHGLRHIAFICGPLENSDASQRLESFLSSIKEFGIELDPQLTVQGDFLRPSGNKAIEALLNLKNSHFDAIISASDEMALGAMDELNKRHINVPAEVAIIGFDDIEDAKTTLPPLTTVRQPLYEMGKQAIDILEAQIHGKPVEKKKIFPTNLIIRQTCGCGFDKDTLITHKVGSFKNRSETRSKPEEKYLAQLIDALNISKLEIGDLSAQATLLMNSFKEALKSPDQISKLLNIVFDVARNVYSVTNVEPSWYQIMAVLSNYAIEAAESSEELLSNIRICNMVWEVFGKISWLSTSSYRLKNERKTEPIRQISDSLVSTFNVRALMNTMITILPELGINQCWISVFDQSETMDKKAQLILGYDKNRHVEDITGKVIYSANQLIPLKLKNRDERSNLIIFPLKFKDDIFGFSIFEKNIHDISIYELISTQISTAYQGAKIVEELKQTQEKLQEQANIDILTQIYNRRYFLEFANTTFTTAYRYKRQLSLLLIDIDNFKCINDRFGHNAGDSILRMMAQIFKKNVRLPDILARYGGDEFVSIMPETTLEEALICAERLRKLVEKQNFGINNKKIKLTISIGVSCLSHQADQSLDSLIDRADQALYQAKLIKNSVFNFEHPVI